MGQRGRPVFASSARSVASSYSLHRLREVIRPAGRWLGLLPESILSTAVGLLPLLVCVNVFARYTGLFTAAWIEEVLAILFLTVSFIGGAVAVKQNAHFRFTTLLDRLPALARYFETANQCALAALGVAVLLLGVQLVFLSPTLRTPILGIPTSATFIVVPVSGALIVAYAVRGARMAWRGTRMLWMGAGMVE